MFGLGKGVSEKIRNLEYEQKRFLTDFYKKLDFWQGHKNPIKKIVSSFNNFKQTKDRGVLNSLRSEGKKILDEISDFVRWERSVELSVIGKNLKKEEKGYESDFYEKFDRAKKLRDFVNLALNTNAGNRVKVLVKDIEERAKEERVAVGLCEHLENIIDEMKVLISEERKMVDEIVAAIRVVSDLRDDVNDREIDNIFAVLGNLFDEMRELKILKMLRVEKDRVIDPFNKFLSEKEGISRRVFEKKEGEMITIDEISADIRMFTKVSETLGYLSKLREFIDNDYFVFDNKGDKKRVLQFLRLAEKSAAKGSEKKEVEMAEIKKELKYDSLTGVLTRRVFDEDFKNFFLRAKEGSRRGRKPFIFSFFILDIDFFKKINDTYGHPVGDLVLKRVASIIKGSVRPVDNVYRYGGEEFCVLLPDADKKIANDVAERIRKNVEIGSFSIMKEINLNVLLSEKKRIDIKFTISIGASTFPDKAETSDELKKHTDEALYKAKEEGRNRVVWQKAA